MCIRDSIEPQGSTWIEDAGSRAQATVTKSDGTSFREFVVQHQTDINMRFADGSPVPNLAGPTGAEDPEDSAQKAINYRTCLLYTSDAADERSSVDLGGRRI